MNLKEPFFKRSHKGKTKTDLHNFLFYNVKQSFNLQSVSIHTLAFLCSYITLTKVLNVSTQRCLQFIHRQYAVEVKQNMTHRNASGQILSRQIRCKSNNKLCYMYSEVPV